MRINLAALRAAGYPQRWAGWGLEDELPPSLDWE